jgi:hypothetical protein
MTKTEIQEREKRAVNLLMEAVEEGTALLAIYDDLCTGGSPLVTLDAAFIQAGVNLKALILSLGSGPGSARASFDAIR